MRRQLDERGSGFVVRVHPARLVKHGGERVGVEIGIARQRLEHAAVLVVALQRRGGGEILLARCLREKLSVSERDEDVRLLVIRAHASRRGEDGLRLLIVELPLREETLQDAAQLVIGTQRGRRIEESTARARV